MNIKKILYRSVFLVSAILILPILAQAQLSLKGQFRPRLEYRNGYRALRTPTTEPAFFISQRSRLILNYRTDLYEMHVSGQDVRVWGEVNQLQDNPNVNIHEVWARLKLYDNMDIKLGRQELVYDDHRLLGSVNWTQQARSHDALVFKYGNEDSNFKLDFGAAYNQNSENLLGNTYTLSNYKFLSYLWFHKTMGPLKASVIGITDGFENAFSSVNYRYTYGTHLTYSNNNLILNGTLYLQNGDDALRNNINAWMYALKAGYSFDDFTITAGIDYLSGGGADDQNPQRKAFNTLYATNHKFYGHMDYFLNVPGDTRSGGLQDIYVGATYNIDSNTGLNATYHNFSLAETIVNPQNSGMLLDKALGSEIDMNISHKFSSEISLKAGYSILLPANALEEIKSVDAEPTQHWGWVMLSVTPTFLK